MKISEISEKGRNGFFWLLLGTVGQNSLQLISIIVLARVLSPEEFGVVGIGAAIIAFLRIFSEVGVGPALVQKDKITTIDIQTATAMSLILGFVLSGILYFAASSISVFFETPVLAGVLKALAFMLPIVSYSVVGQSLLQRNLEFKKLSVITFVSYFTAYGIVSIYMALHGYGMWSLVAAYWVQAAIYGILLLINCPEARRVSFGLRSAKDMLNYGFGHSLARVWNYVAGQGDNLVIGKLLGAGSVGLYSRAYQVMSMPAILFGSVIDKVFFPLMARIKSNTTELLQLYLSSISFSLIVFVYFSGYIYLFAEEIIYVLFGPGWEDVATLIKVMAVGLYFRIGYKFSDCLTMAVGKIYQRAVVQFMYAVAVLGFVLIGSRWGLFGASVGVVIAIFLNYLMMMYLAWGILNFRLLPVFLGHLKTLGLFVISIFLFNIAVLFKPDAWPFMDFIMSSLIYLACAIVVIVCFSRFLVGELLVVQIIFSRRG